ncbi:MAG: hypothetical protein F6K36_21825 [Symploca sp. SIO3C6]|nr:hypothetical protein [Symploca sp. SIO3C6]
MALNSLISGLLIFSSSVFVPFSDTVDKSPDIIVQGDIILAQENNLIVRDHGFLFEFLGCEKTSSGRFKCNLLIKNIQEDRRLRLYRSSSRVIDTSGNEIPASRVGIGSNSSTNLILTNMPKEIPIKSFVSFDSLPEGDIALIELYFDVDLGPNFKLKIQPIQP